MAEKQLNLKLVDLISVVETHSPGAFVVPTGVANTLGCSTKTVREGLMRLEGKYIQPRALCPDDRVLVNISWEQRLTPTLLLVPECPSCGKTHSWDITDAFFLMLPRPT